MEKGMDDVPAVDETSSSSAAPMEEELPAFRSIWRGDPTEPRLQFAESAIESLPLSSPPLSELPEIELKKQQPEHREPENVDAKQVVLPATEIASATSAEKVRPTPTPAVVEDKLYDREEHLNRLIQAYQTQCSSKSKRLVLISGPSGTGKSRLAHDIRPHMHEGGIFLRGKFDQLKKTAVTCGFASSFARLLRQCRSRVSRTELRNEILLQTEGQASMLIEMMPQLEEVLVFEEGETEASDANSATAAAAAAAAAATTTEAAGELHSYATITTATTRPVGAASHLVLQQNAADSFRRVFCQFASVLCRTMEQAAPVVLFLDDLQWADMESLETMEALVTHEALADRLLVIGACRNNEVDARSHPLAELLRRLEDDYRVQIDHIVVENLNLQTTYQYVLDNLRPPSGADVEPLAKVVYERTQGNVLFIQQLLHAIDEADISLPWHADYDLSLENHENKVQDFRTRLACFQGSANQSSSADPIVQLMTYWIEQLPLKEQILVQVASCMGAHFDAATVVAAANLPDGEEFAIDLSKPLWVRAVALGLVAPVDGSPNPPKKLRFIHDRVQQAAYEMVPEEFRPQNHLDIGRRLWKHFSTTQNGSEVDGHALNLIVNQLERGLECLVDQEERAAVSRLFWAAGRNAAEQGSHFQSAFQYLDQARSLLPLRHWRDHYDLSLEIFTSAAQVANVVGQYEQSDLLVEEILEHGRNLLDVMPAHTVKMESLAARNQLESAIDLGFEVLSSKFGEKMLRRPNRQQVHRACRRTLAVLSKVSDDDVLNLPRVICPEATAHMKLLDLTFSCAIPVSDNLATLIANRIVQLSFSEGLSAISATGLSIFAARSCFWWDLMEEGQRLGALSLKVLKSFERPEWTARTYVTGYGLVTNSLKAPYQESIDAFHVGCKMGVMSGDMEFSCNCYNFGSLMALLVAPNLQEYYDEWKVKYDDNLRSHKHTAHHNLHIPTVQFAAKLLGHTDQRMELPGGIFASSVQGEGYDVAEVSVLTLKALLAYIMNDYTAADEYLACIPTKVVRRTKPWIRHLHCYIEALTNLRQIPKAGWFERSKRFSRVTQSIKDLEFLATFASHNIQHRILHLQADLSVVREQVRDGSPDVESALELYSKAAREAGERGMIMDQALILEHRAMFEYQSRRPNQGFETMQASRKLFEAWGAIAKVDVMT